MNPTKIFTFWEPKGRMPAYLRLCLRTWERHLPSEFQVIVTDYSNIETYIGKGTYDLELIKTLPLMCQKDAFQVAMLRRHGGLFLDADTLVTRDISWLLRHLDKNELVLFNLHLGIMAARPGARLLASWEEGIRRRLEELKASVPPKVEWDFTGNSVMTEAMIEATLGLPFCRLFDRLWRSRSSYHSASKTFWQKVANQRRWLIRIPPYRRQLCILSPRQHGLIAENSYFGRFRDTSRQRYLEFWFEPGRDLGERGFSKNPSLIYLHNSWTPDWYRELSEEGVLSQDAFLSKTLRRLTQDPRD